MLFIILNQAFNSFWKDPALVFTRQACIDDSVAGIFCQQGQCLMLACPSWKLMLIKISEVCYLYNFSRSLQLQQCELCCNNTLLESANKALFFLYNTEPFYWQYCSLPFVWKIYNICFTWSASGQVHLAWLIYNKNMLSKRCIDIKGIDSTVKNTE